MGSLALRVLLVKLASGWLLYNQLPGEPGSKPQAEQADFKAETQCLKCDIIRRRGYKWLFNVLDNAFPNIERFIFLEG